MLLGSKGGDMKPSNLPKSKMRRPETKVYVKWVIEEIKKDRKSFDGFIKGKGIIATREKFLKFLETEEGMKALALASAKNANETDTSKTDKPTKTIILPVAIPGCGAFFFSISYFVLSTFSYFPLKTGKTSLSVALAHIFGFGHTQSDDIQINNKKAAPLFVKKVVNLLEKHDVVIADKYICFFFYILNFRSNFIFLR